MSPNKVVLSRTLRDPFLTHHVEDLVYLVNNQVDGFTSEELAGQWAFEAAEDEGTPYSMSDEALEVQLECLAGRGAVFNRWDALRHAQRIRDAEVRASNDPEAREVCTRTYREDSDGEA